MAANEVRKPLGTFRQANDTGTLARQLSQPPGPVGGRDVVASMSFGQRFLTSFRDSGKYLSPELREQFESLFSDENKAITLAMLLFWAESHAYGVGEAADTALLVIMLATLGWGAMEGIDDLIDYVSMAAHATTSRELDMASRQLARAFIKLGIVGFLALVVRFGARGSAAATADSTATLTVGRWMSRVEYDAMVKSGSVQESLSGGGYTNVLNPPNPVAYKAAVPGSLYVEFDVPASSVLPKSVGQGLIPGPSGIYAKLALRKGLPVPQMPKATNIKIVAPK